MFDEKPAAYTERGPRVYPLRTPCIATCRVLYRRGTAARITGVLAASGKRDRMPDRERRCRLSGLHRPTPNDG
jgi:hypothetical protein